MVLLLGCFPASFFAVQEMLTPAAGDERQRDFRRWMLMLFWVVLVAFSLVQTKVVHYSSLGYFPLTYLAALQLERIVVGREPFGWTALGGRRRRLAPGRRRDGGPVRHDARGGDRAALARPLPSPTRA